MAPIHYNKCWSPVHYGFSSKFSFLHYFQTSLLKADSLCKEKKISLHWYIECLHHLNLEKYSPTLNNSLQNELNVASVSLNGICCENMSNTIFMLVFVSFLFLWRSVSYVSPLILRCRFFVSKPFVSICNNCNCFYAFLLPTHSL